MDAYTQHQKQFKTSIFTFFHNGRVMSCYSDFNDLMLLGKNN